MYEQVSWFAFIGILVLLLIHFFIKPPVGYGRTPLAFAKLKIRALMRLLPRRGMGLLGLLKRLALAVAALCFAFLLVTGFLPLFLGRHLQGYLLMLHVSCAPVFVLCIAFLGCTWAHAHSYVAGNGKWLLRWLGLASTPVVGTRPDLGMFRKTCFWCLFALSLPLTLSIILGMVPLFGTDGQVALLTLHRYTALAFSLIAFIYAYGLMRYTARVGG